jgi:hypothetical protein
MLHSLLVSICHTELVELGRAGRKSRRAIRSIFLKLYFDKLSVTILKRMPLLSLTQTNAVELTAIY